MLRNKAGPREGRGLDKLRGALAEIYTPGFPIDDPRLFSGRVGLLAELRNELAVRGTHFVLYGERGIGKTSLWQVLLHGRRVKRHAASATDDFVTIFRRVLEEIGEDFTAVSRTDTSETSMTFGKKDVIGVGVTDTLETGRAPLAQAKVDLNLVLDRIARHSGEIDAIVIDEFQRIKDPAVHAQINEVLKALSDHTKLKMVIVGIADDVDQLLTSPASDAYKGRHLLIRRVPQMTDEETRNILEVRERRFGIVFNGDVKHAIVQISSGYPAVAHRLAFDAASAWLVRAAVGLFTRALSTIFASVGAEARSVKSVGFRVEAKDLRIAVERFHRDFQADHENVARRYKELVESSRHKAVARLLDALGSSATTRLGLEELAIRSGVDQKEARALVPHAKGLIEQVDTEYRLAVREMRAFIEADHYLSGS